MTFLDIFGYVASVLVAVSLMMSNVLRLRIINTVGALTFAIYGYLVGAYPVLVVNGWIFLVFDKQEDFRKSGFEIYQTTSFVKEHIKYLKKLGFNLAENSKGCFVKNINQ
jgi:hypothetical protein